MMTISAILYSFLPTLIIFFTACVSPGPNTVLSISTALSDTKNNLAFMCLGLACGGIFWSFLSLLGINVLIIKYPLLLQIIATAGGVYLIYLGFKTLKHLLNTAWAATGLKINSPSKNFFPSHYQAFATGLMTTLTNPKVALLWVSLSPMIPIKPDQTMILFFYSLIIASIVFSVYFSIGLLFSGKGTVNFYSKNTVVFDSLFAAVFITLGGYFLIVYSI